ncbi:hypothetical protein OZ656_06055 [Marinobacter sp. LM1]|jgi:outer membrane murein-binding lipoprotein Lpp|uniref:hypothetical protein n=1 Tax=Gammaproteobacteria TaxID=1236 RepID=UPI000ECA49AE|nr:hypothetical protein [Spongiibacter sp.]HCP19586.1 hypothetical protein [Marinobacter nauticus]|tara:strand:- start:14747 stop:15013 length:267 start_codon:yes stop_codon:yes gene_type:complete
MADRRGWHVDKGIPIAVIITVIMLAVGISRDQAKQDERIALVESSVQMIQQSRISDQQRSEKKFDELKTDLRLISGKLDRLIEDRRND